ncbi:type VI immunity family protein [Corallococcus llansteffanensis]|nr:type VI immunity family protein [Corallococcus llansteffanensis]
MMTLRVPEVREAIDIEGEPVVLLREGVSIAFYIRAPHEEIAPALWHALERYRQAIQPRHLGWYVDYSGDWLALDSEGEAGLRARMLEPSFAILQVKERPDSVTGVAFHYRGHGNGLSDFRKDYPHSICAVEFHLPIEFLDDPGPEWIRALALDLGRELPWSSGHAGLSLEVGAWIQSLTPLLREKTLRHPGFDLPQLNDLALHLGSQVRAPAWLTFLGPPVLKELGGAEGLRSRLTSPKTTIHALSEDRVVVSLGPVPEAGDLEAGDTLPHYRELARVLEPWLYAHPYDWGGFTKEEVRRWERRFL